DLNLNAVALGEKLALRAFRNLAAISTRAHELLDAGLDRITRFVQREPRLTAVVPPGGNVVFPRLPAGIDSERLTRHLERRYRTLIVPGRFFESPRHIRLSFGCNTRRLERGLRNVSKAL